MAEKKILVDNKAVPVEETKTKFGIGQIGNTTPIWAKNAFRVALYVATALVLVTQTITEIPEPIKVSIAKYALEAITLIHALTKLFGVQLDENK